MVIVTLSIGWAAFILLHRPDVDSFRAIESHLLHYETYDSATANMLLGEPAQNVTACDSHSQHALLLLEMPLTEAAFHAGNINVFDQHLQSLEARSRSVLACNPRDSFVWLLAFKLRTMHGELNDTSFSFLDMSYVTSPNEAWISVRRIAVAAPLLPALPDTLKIKVITEFQNLISDGFLQDAMRAYFACSEATRFVLRSSIGNLSSYHQKQFREFLDRSRTG